jgi:hypothetical protein
MKEQTAQTETKITDADLKWAIEEEIAELLRTEREKIIKRAHKRLRAKFGKG